MINEYRIVIGETFTDVENEVAALIHENWVPQGGISVSICVEPVRQDCRGDHVPAEHHQIIAQAMVRTKRSAE